MGKKNDEIASGLLTSILNTYPKEWSPSEAYLHQLYRLLYRIKVEPLKA